MSPSASTRPLWMSSTRRVSASTSCRMWLDTSTVLPSRPELLHEVDHAPAVHRVEPGHRLVEQQHLGLVGDRLRDLDALPHALAVAADLAVLRVQRARPVERRQRALLALGLLEAGQPQQARHELQAREVLPERVRLRAEADAVEDLGRAPGRAAQQPHLALAGRELARRELQERRLAGAVRAQQAGDARRHRGGHVVERDDRSVPARGADELDGRRDGGAVLIARSPPRARACAGPAGTRPRPRPAPARARPRAARVARREPRSASPSALMHACTDSRIAGGQCDDGAHDALHDLQADHQAEEGEPGHPRAARERRDGERRQAERQRQHQRVQRDRRARARPAPASGTAPGPGRRRRRTAAARARA